MKTGYARCMGDPLLWKAAEAVPNPKPEPLTQTRRVPEPLTHDRAQSWSWKPLFIDDLKHGRRGQ